MLGAGDHVDPRIVRQRRILLAERIGVQQRSALLPILGRGVGLDQRGIGRLELRELLALDEQRGLRLGHRVDLGRRRERKPVLREVVVLVLRAGTGRLGERRIEEDAADAGDVGVHAVEHGPALLVAIEAVGDVVAQVAASLGEADGQRMADLAAGRRDRRRVVAQPAHQVAGRGEAQRLDLGILCLVVEFVDMARQRRAVGELDRLGDDEGPLAARQLLSRFMGTRPYRQPRPGLLHTGRLARQLEDLEGATARARDELVAHGLDDRRPSLMGGDRHGQAQPHVGTRRTGVPTRPHDGVAAMHREAVADIGHGLGVVHALRTVAEIAEQHLAAAIVDLVEDVPVAFGGILGPQDEDVGRVLDAAPGIERRVADQRDAPVVGKLRIDLASGLADHTLVSSDFAERCAVGEGFDAFDVQGQQH